MKITIIVILLFLIPVVGILYAEKDAIKTEEDALSYVYSLSDIFNWDNNEPPFCQIIKGGFLDEHDGDTFMGLGVITAETWDKLGLQEDVVYKEGKNFVVERNICILPNYKKGVTQDFSEHAKDAKLVRVRETVTPAREYSSDIIKIITDKPPLIEIFHVD